MKRMARLFVALPKRSPLESLRALILFAFRAGCDTVEIAAMLSGAGHQFTEPEVVRLLHAAQDAEKGQCHA